MMMLRFTNHVADFGIDELAIAIDGEAICDAIKWILNSYIYVIYSSGSTIYAVVL